ncbi:NitT/TauT family transport system ATP-binding protein [Roseiarcus fermentans]|uniref:NitT/TauT family transport system ATP-binding protein n=1 Tax=Roseiarcus fermentans TaxID=1473586 RepID=A0A366FE45_9HYPH|nr:ABC transporter ATP-binding protein [Roseiarcus fermentans]RBP12928.1 NitT/TauT family transport system ATP-binding protein [Roseiarcus fermentans]
MSPAGAPGPLDVRIARKRVASVAGLEVEILSNLAFRLDAGEVGALIGPSGCGKSTAMRIVAGLDSAFEGAVARPQGPLGMVFQEPRLLPWRSVEDNIRLAAPDIGEAEFAALLKRLSLADHRAHFPSELSLGLARRVALARAFAVRPSLLLLDEPFVSLDAPLARALRGELLALVGERAVTTVLVTHDVEEAIRLADRIFVLSPRPARVIGEIRVRPPREGMSAAEARSIKADIDALSP